MKKNEGEYTKFEVIQTAPRHVDYIFTSNRGITKNQIDLMINRLENYKKFKFNG